MLNEFNGTLLFVSHDRYFIDAVADTLWLIEDGGVRRFEGNYSAYAAQRDAQQRQLEEQAQRAKQEAERQAKASKASGATPNAAKKQLQALEREITALEQRKAELDAEIMLASSKQDSRKVGQLGIRYTEVEAMLQEQYTKWERLALEVG